MIAGRIIPLNWQISLYASLKKQSDRKIMQPFGEFMREKNSTSSVT
jgi:hypothetical protein